MVHISAVAIFLIPVVGHIIGPLVLWLLKRQESGFVDAHGVEALNFQISILIYAILVTIFYFAMFAGSILFPFLFFLSFIVFPLYLVLGAFWLTCIVIAAIKAGDGQFFQYPLSIPFIR